MESEILLGEDLDTSLPLDAMLPADGFEIDIVSVAAAVLDTECLSDEGFAFPQVSRAEFLDLLDDRGRSNSRLFGEVESTAVAQNGFHPPPVSSKYESLRSRLLELNGPLGDDAQAVLEEECWPRTQEVVRAGDIEDPQMFALPQSLRREAFEDTLYGGQLEEYGESWRSCMAEEGYDTWRDPVEMREDVVPRFLGDSPTPSAEEIALAVADQKCRVSTGLLAAAFQHQRALEVALVEQHQDDLDQIKTYYEELLERIQDV